MIWQTTTGMISGSCLFFLCAGDAHMREAVVCRKWPRLARECALHIRFKKVKMPQTRINTGILDGKAKTFKKITKNLKNNVDNLTQW